MIDVLHITAHMGGGVGKVLSALSIYPSSNIKHTILCLEPTENKHFYQLCIDAGVKVFLKDEIDVEQTINKYDVIQIEWWHHPLMTEFLVQTLSNIKCRIVVWSHISGCNYPRLPYSFIEAVDEFVFASPYSLENPSWTQEQREKLRANKKIVVSSGNEFNMDCQKKVNHTGLSIGYIGFLGYEKINPKYAEFCEEIFIEEDVQLNIGGDLKYGQQLLTDFKKLKSFDKINMLGYVENVYEELLKLDVFLYLLHPEHTGTAENALLEAMAMGVVPIVMNQCSERYTVQHMRTGILIENKEDCRKAVRWLYDNPQKRKELGDNARRYVQENLSLSKTVSNLEKIYNDVNKGKNKYHNLKSVFGQSPLEWFKSCFAGNEKRLEGVVTGETKGSIKQYLKYFPNEQELIYILEGNR